MKTKNVPTAFNRSWIDKLIDWVETIPIPSWLFYIFSYFTFFLLINIAHWIEDQTAMGIFDLAELLTPLWAIIPLVFLHSANKFAGPALDQFREMITSNNTEFDKIKYQFIYFPAWIVWTIIGIFLVLLTLGTINDPQGFTGFSHLFSVLIYSSLGVLGFSLSFIFIIHTFRRVILVNRIYQLVGNLNIFDLGPVFSLSSLTTRSAIGFVLIANLDFINNVLSTSSAQDFSLALANTFSILLFGSAVILIPLMGIHHKLEKEKNRLMKENAIRIYKANDVLNHRMDEAEFDSISGFGTGLKALFLFRDKINKIPTWP